MRVKSGGAHVAVQTVRKIERTPVTTRKVAVRKTTARRGQTTWSDAPADSGDFAASDLELVGAGDRSYEEF